jgi:hypothetical protein
MKYLFLLIMLCGCTTTQTCFDRTLNFLDGIEHVGWRQSQREGFKFYTWIDHGATIDFILITPLSKEVIEHQTKLRYESECRDGSDFFNVYTLRALRKDIK